MSNNYYLSLSLVFVFLLLSACAERTIPDSSSPPFSASNATPPEQAPEPLLTAASKKLALLETLLACMEQVESLQSSQLAAEIKRLQGKLTMAHSLPDNAGSADLFEQFSLACLLSRDTASEQEWDRAQAILAELALEFEEQGERQLVRYVEHAIGLRRELRRHQAQLNRLRQQNTELQNKIEQLKGLERDLDVNNPYSAESDL